MPEKRFCCELTKKPKAATVIEGFPGFGLVSTIATGFLIDHLKCEQIGKYWFEEGQPTAAVHGCKLVDPISVYYNKKNNLIIVHSIAPAAGMEWKAADIVLDVAKQVQAKEIVTVEGIGTTDGQEARGFFYTANATSKKKLEKIGIDCLGEGIIVGVTSALLLKGSQEKKDVMSLFAETHSKLPDAKAAAKIVELLDKYLGLDVDYKPLLKQAEEFEEKLKDLLKQQKSSKELQKKKQISYVG